MLDFSSLKKAVTSLSEAMVAASLRPDDLLIRDAAIQRFEYTYELCVKSLRRQLTEMADNASEVDALGYRDMIRLGVERGLLTRKNCAAALFGYREMRNLTSHAYDAEKAEIVFGGIAGFLRDARALMTGLQRAAK